MKEAYSEILPSPQPSAAVQPALEGKAREEARGASQGGVLETTARRPAPSLWKKQLVLLALLVGVRCFGLYAIPTDAGPQGKAVQLALAPTMAHWNGRDVPVDPFVYTELHPDAVLQKRYMLSSAGPKSPGVEVLVMYSRDTFGFHPPEVCLKMQGWMIANSEQRILASRDKSLTINVVSAQQKSSKRQIAYCFTDASGEISGRAATFANMILARFIRRRVGTLELQFAYGPDVLQPDGNFTPQFKDLILQTATTIHRQLTSETT